MTSSKPPRKEAPKREVRIIFEPWGKVVDETRPHAYVFEGERFVGQACVVRSKARVRAVMAGRQSGKTLVGIAEICIDALSGRHINWWVCPNYTVKPRAWRGLLDFLPPDVIEKKNETERYVRLVNGSEIWIKSADGQDSLVSESLDFAVCDEAGQWKEAAWNQITPMFAARAGGRALLIGTPRGKNWFYRTWLRGAEKPGEDYESFHWYSADSPYVSQSFLASERETMSRDMYLQEYEANPLDNAAAVFRNFRQCVRNMPMPIDQFMCLGVDLARKLDFSAIVAMNGRKQVTSIERFQEEWPEAQRRVVAAAFRNNFARSVIDATGEGDVVIGNVRESGIQVEEFIISNQSKQRLIDQLRLDFEQSRLSIPSDERLIAELDAYEYEYDEETRKYKFSAPAGQHDDLVIALALANWGQRGVAAYLTQDRVSSYMGGGTASRSPMMAGRPSYMGRR